jgi:peroxiredoxin
VEMRRFAIIFLLVAIGVGLYFLLARQRPASDFRSRSSLKVGDPAPEFALPSLTGKTVQLADYRGRPVFLNFWATWCPPCREEMPSMEALYRKFKGLGLEFMTISLDDDGEGLVRDFLSARSLTFPVLRDAKKEVANRYGLTGVPETFIINHYGEVLAKIVGPQDWASPKWIDFFERLTQKSH